MSSSLEKFMSENRGNFDTETPDPKVWEMIDKKLNPEKKKETPVRSILFKRLMAAAAAVVVLGVGFTAYYTSNQSKTAIPISGAKPVLSDSGNHLPVISTPVDSSARIADNEPKGIKQTEPAVRDSANADVSGNKEMFYYTKLIELKHEELKSLEKDEPLLYKQFAGDVQKLDSVYHLLKTQLPNNSNREQVIEAMIINLQLQMGLLNRQLDIIKQIKHSKKSAYEKAYKAI